MVNPFSNYYLNENLIPSLQFKLKNTYQNIIIKNSLRQKYFKTLYRNFSGQ